ncbi:MAG TPA: cytidylate kinase-like family protein [Gemmataceae bacterium]|jgi:cytidylate kinase|nr:cytidylate kinase-like family protein [Gemmataceae bacterium]
MDEPMAVPESERDSPLHGYRGDRLPAEKAHFPLGPVVAISREVGARGGAIARRLSSKLGWQAFDSEMLEYSAQDPTACASLLAELPPEAPAWIDDRMRWLRQQHILTADETFEREARLILTLGAHGQVVFVGRGAGFLLPRETTLHARIIAPQEDRISYMSQVLRLSRMEAAEQVRQREIERSQFLATCFQLPANGIQYDIILNSSTLGEDLCTDLIIQAANGKCGKLRTGPDENYA